MKFVHRRNTLRFAALLFMTTVTIGALLSAAGSAVAAETRDGTVPAGIKSGPPKISKELATQNALAALPGTVGDVTIEKKHGKNVWVVEVVAETTGAEKDVLVDMESGKVIGTED